jgi:deoxyribonuclease-4
MKNDPRIGGHVSASGGLWKAIDRGEVIGARVIQIYGASPRMWRAPLPKKVDAMRFQSVRSESSIAAVYLHAAYLVNLASSSQDLYKKSVESLIAHLKIAGALGARGLIFHVGSGKGMDTERAIEQEIKGMKEVLDSVPGETFLIMENSAGGGSKIGSGINEIAQLLDGVCHPRVKVCFDTAHAFEAGLVGEYTPQTVRDFCNEWDRKIGLSELVVLHVNDSKTESGSHHDRHENIGEGYIGLSGFRALAKERRFWDKDWILEVPGFSSNGPDKKNIGIVSSLFT